ncbi:MAG: helix-turn-helix domain-containing protein [Chloroflexi bacterium]|nr:helix-turn-helix domain-containing protein [Chloroflexota bacterium]
MNQIKEDLLLHPVRLRIILAIAGRQVTAQQLANELPDIPQATLYRNINLLAAAGFLNVIQERRVRNTVEKIYALPEKDLMLTAEDIKNAQPEDYIRQVAQYLGLLLGYFVRYIDKGDVDIIRDDVLFQLSPIYLSHGEVQSLGKAVLKAMQPYMKNEPSPERRRQIMGLISLPDVVEARLPKPSKAGGSDVESTEAREAKYD